MMKRDAAGAGRRPMPAAARGAPEMVLTPKEALGMLRRHLWLILFMTVLGAAVGGGGWFLVQRYAPLYKAQTAIEVLPPVETDPTAIVAVQVQQDIQYGHRVLLANQIKDQGNLQQLLRNDEVRNTNWFRRKAGDTRRAVESLRKNLIAFPHREAPQVVVSMTCASPKEAAVIAYRAADLFYRQQTVSKQKDMGDKLKELAKQQSTIEGEVAERQTALEKEITRGEEDLAAIRAKYGQTDLDRQGGRYFQHTTTLRLNDLELQQNELSLAIRQLQADIGNLRQLAEGPITEQIEYAIERDPVMLNLAQQLVFLEAQQSGRLTKFGENHRVVRQTQELIDETEARRNQRKSEIAEQTRRANLMNARDSLRVLEGRLAGLEQLRADAKKQQELLDTARAEYDQRILERDERVEKLTRERDDRMTMLDQIRTQVDKLRVMYASPETPKMRAPALAPEPLTMVVSRSLLLWGPGGTMLGLILGVSLALLLEMVNDLVRTPSDVRRFLHVPLLGVVPDANEDRAVDDVDLCHVVDEAPYSLLGECYRRCRTHLELTAEEPFKSVLVAGGQVGDGKTCVACNLAEAFVGKYEKVLLIDGNLRQPSLHLAFPPEASDRQGDDPLGLANFLAGECGLQEIISPGGDAGPDVIYAGPPTANPAELLAGRRMKELLEAVARDYDRVIVDSPPVLLVSDVKLLARLVDATVLVFNAALTRRGTAQRALFELHDVGANIVGCVLFGAEAIKGGYFRQQFRAYRRYHKPQRA